jgi:hypothetical protein
MSEEDFVLCPGGTILKLSKRRYCAYVFRVVGLVGLLPSLILQGSASGEGYDDPPGWLRAYDVLTGKTVWIIAHSA